MSMDSKSLCFFRFAARQFTVRLGDIDLSTDAEPSAPVTFAVKEVRAHERYVRVRHSTFSIF